MTSTTVVNGVPRTTRLDMLGNDDLTVDAGGVFSVSANAQTVRFDGATNGALITNNGTLENTNAGGRAIRFQTGVGTSFTATINTNGDIQADDDAIQIQAGSVTSGTLTLSNGGTINSNSGQALDLAGGTGTFLADITNSVTITALVNDAIRFGGTATLLNFGSINGGSGAANSSNVDGVQFEDNSSGTVTNLNDAGGFISGDRHGINAGLGTVITVDNGTDSTNGGTITGRNGSGVGSDGTATVTNWGTITGGFTAGSDQNGTTVGQPDGGGPDGIDDGDGDGIDIDGQATIENHGTIQGTGAGGSGSDGLPNTSEGIAAGGGTITNYAAAIIQGLGLGILIDDSSQGNAPFVTNIVNDGTITGTNGIGIRIISNLADTIDNAGTITGNGTAIQFGSGANTLTIRDGSVINGDSDGGAGTDTLDYSGYTAGAVTATLGGAATGTGGLSNFENIIGSGQADTLTGNGAVNDLQGGGGDDTLNGDALADILTGGTGNDTFVNPTGDTVVEAAGAGGGLHDLIRSSASYNLNSAANVEDITLSGAGNVNAMGDNFVNILTGNSGNNVLNAGGGADRLIGGGGNDVLNGGQGADVFVFAAAGTGADRINGFETARDRFNLSGGTFTDLNYSGGDTVLTHAGGTIRIVGITNLNLAQWRTFIDNGARAEPHDADAHAAYTGRLAGPEPDPAGPLAAHADFLFG